MLTIREPGWRIENTYDAAGRMIRQMTRVDATPADPRPVDAVIAFAYKVSGPAVTETDVTEYDGTHTIYRFNASHYADVEIRDATGAHPIVLSVERDPVGQYVAGLTVRWTVNGRSTTRSVAMGQGLTEEQAKTVLLTDTCGSLGPVRIPKS